MERLLCWMERTKAFGFCLSCVCLFCLSPSSLLVLQSNQRRRKKEENQKEEDESRRKKNRRKRRRFIWDSCPEGWKSKSVKILTSDWLLLRTSGCFHTWQKRKGADPLTRQDINQILDNEPINPSLRASLLRPHFSISLH